MQALERLEREWVRRLIGIETRAFGVDRLGGFARLEKDPDYQFLSRIVELGEEFLSGLFSHVMDPKSRFFSIELASALSAHHELWQPLWTHAAREGLNHPQVGSEALLAMVRSGPVSVTS